MAPLRDVDWLRSGILASMLGGVVAFLFPRTTIAPSAEIRHKVPAVVEIEPATALRLTPIVDVPAFGISHLGGGGTTLGNIQPSSLTAIR